MGWIGTRIDHDPSAEKSMPDKAKQKRMTKKNTASTMRRIDVNKKRGQWRIVQVYVNAERADRGKQTNRKQQSKQSKEVQLERRREEMRKKRLD